MSVGQPGPPLCESGTLSGTASPEGNTFSAVITRDVLFCPGGIMTCTCVPGSLFDALNGCRTGAAACCGDGVVDAGEQCDDGPQIAGSCCDGTCIPTVAGSSCAGDANLCTVDVCDGAGACTHPPSGTGPCFDDGNACTADVCDGAGTCSHPPAGTGPCPDDGDACTTDVCDGTGTCAHPPLPDGDGDGICDTADPCPLGALLERSKVKLGRFTTPLGDDYVQVKGEVMIPITPPLDPVAKGLRTLVTNADGSGALDDAIPPGPFSSVTGIGWKANAAGTSFKFRGPSARARVVAVKNVSGRVKVTIKLTDRALVAPTAPVGVTVVFDPPVAAGGQCGQTNFATAGTCTVGGHGATLTCK